MKAVISAKPQATSTRPSGWADGGDTAGLRWERVQARVGEMVGVNGERVSTWMTRRPQVLAFLADRSG